MYNQNGAIPDGRLLEDTLFRKSYIGFGLQYSLNELAATEPELRAGRSLWPFSHQSVRASYAGSRRLAVVRALQSAPCDNHRLRFAQPDAPQSAWHAHSVAAIGEHSQHRALPSSPFESVSLYSLLDSKPVNFKFLLLLPPLASVATLYSLSNSTAVASPTALR